MAKRNVEIMVGLFVALALAALFMLAMKVSNLSGLQGVQGYHLTANFDNIGGLKVRAPVTASGVLVGRVSAIRYDTQQFQAEVTLLIEPQYAQFPEDSSASIFTAGLLGEQYIGLEPGAEEVVLREGDELQVTQSAMVLEELIGKFLFDKASGE
ncbi:MAG: outer membrane lipid asymmetry maintenance protein MlaD [Gammaproteobacteria bacterium]|nr:outer membrane lipid asymmetry maintenance protein MlaD [Gammaproteobacteria bacterium]